MAYSDLSEETRAELGKRYAMYDPVKLQGKVHKAVDALVSMNKATNLKGVEALAASSFQAI